MLNSSIVNILEVCDSETQIFAFSRISEMLNSSTVNILEVYDSEARVCKHILTSSRFHIAIIYGYFLCRTLRTCKDCVKSASPTTTFSEFTKTKSSRTNPERARCDNCWHLWAPCIKCKRKLPKSEFDFWLSEFPSRRHTGKCKLVRCNACMRETKDAAAKQSKQDIDAVTKKRRTDNSS